MTHDYRERLIDREFLALKGLLPTCAQRAMLWKRMRVHAFDVAEGGVTERQAVTALAATTRSDPAMLWNVFVATCLSLAKDRLSIDKDGLLERVGKFLKLSSDSTLSAQTELVQEGNFLAGREVLLVRDDEGRTILTDLKRFEDDGRRRVRFGSGAVILKSDVRWTVLRRTSTYERMTSEISSGALISSGDGLVLMPSTYEEDLNASPVAQAHSDLCAQLLKENEELLACLQCGRPISEHGAYFVEVDEEELPHEVGLVHRGCLRSTHRITGVIRNELFEKNPGLADFDFSTWVRRLASGQGAFNSPLVKAQRHAVLAWESHNGEAAVGNYAVSYDLADGTTRYILTRGRVARFPKHIAEARAAEFNEHIATAAAARDPFSANDDGFAPSSVLIAHGDPTPNHVISAAACEVSRSTVLAHSTVENFYAPLFYLVDLVTGGPFLLGDAAVLMTDPLRLGQMISNWSNAGYPIDSYATVILATDTDFDLFMHRIKGESLQVVIDPLLGTDGSPLSEKLVVSFQEIVEHGQSI